MTKINDMQGKKVFVTKKARPKKSRKSEKASVGERSGVRLSKLGKIRMAVFAPDGHSMVGYLVARPDIAGMVKREDAFVAFDSLVPCERGFRTVDEEGAFDDKARERLGVDWDSCIMWAGMDARTESGRELGYVGDVEFDEKTGKVIKFLVSDGGMATALVGSIEIPPSMLVGYSKGHMIVRDEAARLGFNGGLAAKAGEATAKAKIRGAELGEKAGKATSEAVDKGSFALGKALGKARRAIDDARAEGEEERAREEAEELRKAAEKNQLPTTEAADVRVSEPVVALNASAEERAATSSTPRTYAVKRSVAGGSAKPAAKTAARPAAAKAKKPAAERKAGDEAARALGRGLNSMGKMFGSFKDEFDKASK
ncbi:PRC-barrel domain-containing protein [Olsenella sp. Marseille-P4559]|uniref:PRC-barrel domain-containing protein n=1 Tax=Olsenella sp. Marseille-P4559 TaxID=2364795 RepID=UPI0010326904|nr:PRC-barrel domain-containing protein [Olsenella sp. Marseille-P4559]